MFKNYLKITYRNLRRKKGFAFINIFSLTVGVTCFILLMMYVKYEVSYDSFHPNKDRLFQVGMYWEGWNVNGSSYFSSMNGALIPVLRDEFIDVEYAARVQKVSSSLKYEENSVKEDGIYADKDFLNMFHFPLTKGDKNTALQNPFSIVLTEKLAKKLFGSENPMGKTLFGKNGGLFLVTGICSEIPDNSHLKFDFIFSFETKYSARENIDRDWGILDYHSYIVLKENVSSEEFEDKLVSVVEKYHGNEEKKRSYFLRPVESIHLCSYVNSEIFPGNDKKFITMFSVIAFFILIIACVNYINLATSQTAFRSKEVGIRKTIGARRSELVQQFLGESFVLTILAVLFSLALVYFIHPYFTAFVNLNIPLRMLLEPASIFYLIGLTVFIGFLSGSYPSLLLSSFIPVNVLKNGVKSNSTGRWFKLRNVLVVFQFLVSIILIIATLVVRNQLNFMKNKDIGYDRENIVTIDLWNTQNLDKFEAVKEELVRNTDIISAAISDRAPLQAFENNSVRVETESNEEMAELPRVTHFFVDYDFIDVFNIKIKEGRDFSLDFSTDPQQAIIVNETLVNMVGLKNPVGRNISSPNRRDARIIGVVKDFHFSSFTDKIGPIAFLLRSQWAAKMFSVKIVNRDVNKTLDFINQTFQKHINGFVFNYSFMEDSYNKLYSSEDKMGTLFFLFSVIAISIASFGLFGLITLFASQKTKEIGIRKILGASISKIIALVVKEFAAMVVVSSLIALPLAYTLMSRWLHGFEYRIDISLGVLLISILITSMVTILSVLFQVIKAARANPADSLRYE